MKEIESEEYEGTFQELAKAFQEGEISLGQLSSHIEKSKHETIQLLGSFGIVIADYDLEEDLCFVDDLMG